MRVNNIYDKGYDSGVHYLDAMADNNQLPIKFYGLCLFEMACSTLKEVV